MSHTVNHHKKIQHHLKQIDAHLVKMHKAPKKVALPKKAKKSSKK